jgi:hypothetical protein
VAANKQGVRLKEYVYERISEKIGQEITNVRESIKRIQAKSAAKKSGAGASEAERRATDAEPYQGQPLPELEDDEKTALENNLRALAIVIKREGETDEEAYQRLKSSDYVTVYKYDEYWPFYHCDFKFGKVILTINTAHLFFSKILQPLTELTKEAIIAQESGDDNIEVSKDIGKISSEILIGIQSLLFSLARTQSQLSSINHDEGFEELFDKLKVEWSNNLSTQLTAR